MNAHLHRKTALGGPHKDIICTDTKSESCGRLGVPGQGMYGTGGVYEHRYEVDPNTDQPDPDGAPRVVVSGGQITSSRGENTKPYTHLLAYKTMIFFLNIAKRRKMRHINRNILAIVFHCSTLCV